MQELNEALLKSRIEFRAAQEQMQEELSLLQEQVTDLRGVSEEKGKKIQQLSDQIDTDEKKVGMYELACLVNITFFFIVLISFDDKILKHFSMVVV